VNEGQQLTWVLQQAGQDIQTSTVCIAVLWFGQDVNNLALVPNFNKIFSISNCSGLDIIKYPTCSNTWPLLSLLLVNFGAE
jgi:hypothetical protein